MRYSTVQTSTGLRLCLTVGLFLAAITCLASAPAEAREGTKTIKLYFGHTKERGEFTFKRNGRYDKKELARINRFLRDWRRNEPANLDPKLLDLVWAIYQEAGGREPIHVVSAYRSLKTNNLLRSRSKGVAKTSQHTAGKAMDFYIPGVPLAKLRATAMKFQGGGVGYYPTSGSPFVHVDTGNVRSWPRMSRKQLLALFPKGDTLYLPADGKPLPGYEKALARRKTSGGTELAYLDVGSTQKSGKGGWLKRMFSGGADQVEDDEAAGVSTSTPVPDEPVIAAPAAPVPAAPGETVAPAGVETSPALPADPTLDPAMGEPQILIASEENGASGLADAGPRLPRARPGTEAPVMLALAAEMPAAPPPLQTVPDPSLAYAALPRERPDPGMLAGTLDAAGDTRALSVRREDAIAALVAGAQSASPAPDDDLARLQTAASESRAALLSAADRESVDGLTAIREAVATADAGQAAAPLPRPRPLAMAFAATGLPAAEPPPKPATATLSTAVKGDRKAASRSAAAPAAAVRSAAAPAAAPIQEADRDDLDRLISNPDSGFSGFSMPRPGGAPNLFTAPASASSVASQAVVPRLPEGRFDGPATPAGGEDSFLSRLFASLSE